MFDCLIAARIHVRLQNGGLVYTLLTGEMQLEAAPADLRWGLVPEDAICECTECMTL
jgi:hypothetical protein